MCKGAKWQIEVLGATIASPTPATPLSLSEGNPGNATEYEPLKPKKIHIFEKVSTILATVGMDVCCGLECRLSCRSPHNCINCTTEQKQACCGLMLLRIDYFADYVCVFCMLLYFIFKFYI